MSFLVFEPGNVVKEEKVRFALDYLISMPDDERDWKQERTEENAPEQPFLQRYLILDGVIEGKNKFHFLIRDIIWVVNFLKSVW